MDVELSGLDDPTDALEVTLDRLGELRAGPRVASDAFLAEAFVDEHTRYDSFEAFRADAPVDVPPGESTADTEELNAFVRDATEFEAWEELRARAAEEELLDQLLADPA